MQTLDPATAVHTPATDAQDIALNLALEHRQCADIHERACRHFREAARLYERNDLAQGAIHSSIARGHVTAAMQSDTLRTAPSQQSLRTLR